MVLVLLVDATESWAAASKGLGEDELAVTRSPPRAPGAPSCPHQTSVWSAVLGPWAGWVPTRDVEAGDLGRCRGVVSFGPARASKPNARSPPRPFKLSILLLRR